MKQLLCPPTFADTQYCAIVLHDAPKLPRRSLELKDHLPDTTKCFGIRYFADCIALIYIYPPQPKYIWQRLSMFVASRIRLLVCPSTLRFKAIFSSFFPCDRISPFSRCSIFFMCSTACGRRQAIHYYITVHLLDLTLPYLLIRFLAAVADLIFIPAYKRVVHKWSEHTQQRATLLPKNPHSYLTSTPKRPFSF